MNNKLIFLDIDGVLNHDLYYKEKSQSERRKEYGFPYCEIDPNKVKELNQLIFKTGAKVVISSTWRKGRSIEELREILEARGFVGEIIGVTPNLRYQNDMNKGDGSKWVKHTVPRGCEIFEYIEQNYEWEESKKVKYVILDDDSDMLLWQKDNFIWVDPYAGLTPNLVWKARKILGDL